MLLEEANQTLIDNSVLGALLSNTNLSEDDLRLVSKWGHEPMTRQEVIQMLSLLQLQILPLG